MSDTELYESAWTHVELETVYYTWVVLGLIMGAALVARWCLLWHPSSLLSYAIKWATRLVVRTVNQTCHQAPQRYISFFSALFLFLLVANCLAIIPTLREPTENLNTALALSLIVFLFVQFEAARHHGMLAYGNELFKTPFAVRGVYARWTPRTIIAVVGRIVANILVGTLMLPLELLGKVSSVISLAFRLFGNILAGAVISAGWLYFRSGSWIWQTVGLVSGLNLLIMLFFGIFEGVVQAFVFVMLALSGLGRALQSHE